MNKPNEINASNTNSKVTGIDQKQNVSANHGTGASNSPNPKQAQSNAPIHAATNEPVHPSLPVEPVTQHGGRTVVPGAKDSHGAAHVETPTKEVGSDHPAGAPVK